MEEILTKEYFKEWKSVLDVDIQKEFSAIQQKEVVGYERLRAI